MNKKRIAKLTTELGSRVCAATQRYLEEALVPEGETRRLGTFTYATLEGHTLEFTATVEIKNHGSFREGS